MTAKAHIFTDKAFVNVDKKTLISLRDGTQEYLGFELGIEPSGKIFNVFRSAETIRSAVGVMDGLSITDEHISTDCHAPDSEIGTITRTEIKPHTDNKTNTTITVKNEVLVSDDILSLIDSGKKELSLGYKAKLIKHDLYDFEQTSIIPHHLAIVSAGRCGAVCSFNDKGKPMTEEEKKLADEEAAKKKADELKEKEAKDAAAEEEAKDAEADEEEEAKDGEKPTFKKGEKPDFKDSREFHDAVTVAATKMAIEMTDKAMSKLLPERVIAHAQATEKGRDYLDDKYSFADKTPCQIKRDVLATQTDRSFSDEELDASFEVLTIKKDYSTFGDQKADDVWTEIADQEIGAK